MRKKILLVIPAIILIILIGICVLTLNNRTSKISLEKAESVLLEHLSDSSDFGYIYIEYIDPSEQEIYINDRQVFRSENAYVFGTRYNENKEGLEDRWAGDYAVSLDGKKVYWYDPANDWHVDYDDLLMYNVGTGEWTDD